MWMDNEEQLYADKMRFLRRTVTLTEKNVREFVMLYFPNGTPDMNKKEFEQVNWTEIAESWESEQDDPIDI